MPGTELSHAALKAKQRAIRQGFPEALGLRVHRALSWLGRAERESKDPDLRFILLWIGFNAAYAADLGTERLSTRDEVADYFARLCRLDGGNRIYATVWTRFPQEIRLLLDNRYVFAPFWCFQNGDPAHANWEARLAAEKRQVLKAMKALDTPKILRLLFERLYVLRNQLVHGGATWGGKVNRAQVKDGAAILGTLLPIFLDLMMDHPAEDWGRPYYPVVDA
ncbi:MAG: hypothetical protein SNJ63_10740 [Sphingomonadaceae bacterium]